jgi:hypothetical protein
MVHRRRGRRWRGCHRCRIAAHGARLTLICSVQARCFGAGQPVLSIAGGSVVGRSAGVPADVVPTDGVWCWRVWGRRQARPLVREPVPEPVLPPEPLLPPR